MINILACVFLLETHRIDNERETHTSCSPTTTCTTLPLGTTCARSPSFTGPPCLSCTRKLSSTCGLNLPPCLNCERSLLSFSIASLMSDSKALKSNGSSEPAVAAEEEEEEDDSAREASRAALPPFLNVAGVLLKVRMVGV